MPDSSAYARSRARVVRMAENAHDDRALRRAVIAELRDLIGFDAYAWVLTDPATSVGAAPLAEVPWLAELPRHIRLKYLTPVNRWTGLDRPAALLNDVTGGEPAQSLLWRELLAGHGVGDVASAVFRDRFGCWAFLELMRDAARGTFTPGDLAFLTDLADPLTFALRRLQAATFAASSVTELPHEGPVVLLLSPELEVRAQTQETQDYLARLVPPATGRAPIPASAYNVAAQLLAVEAGVDANLPTARVHLVDGVWLTLRAARLDGPGRQHERDIAVTIEPTPPAQRIDLFARAFGLSPRESELLNHLAAGADTRELAGRLFLSEHTVQDHLKSIFAKTSTRSRRTLLSRALGT
ncbi:MAG: LuxR C-terminal-related transcriptional regulator [Actinomycetota bacterium]